MSEVCGLDAGLYWYVPSTDRLMATFGRVNELTLIHLVQVRKDTLRMYEIWPAFTVRAMELLPIMRENGRFYPAYSQSDLRLAMGIDLMWRKEYPVSSSSSGPSGLTQ